VLAKSVRPVRIAEGDEMHHCARRSGCRTGPKAGGHGLGRGAPPSSATTSSTALHQRRIRTSSMTCSAAAIAAVTSAMAALRSAGSPALCARSTPAGHLQAVLMER
jgi:hypothetical protein